MFGFDQQRISHHPVGFQQNAECVSMHVSPCVCPCPSLAAAEHLSHSEMTLLASVLLY